MFHCQKQNIVDSILAMKNKTFVMRKHLHEKYIKTEEKAKQHRVYKYNQPIHP